MAYEFARVLDELGCHVRIYNPRGLPVRDPALENDVKVRSSVPLPCGRMDLCE